MFIGPLRIEWTSGQTGAAPAGGGGSSNVSLTHAVTQLAHPFAVNEPVYNNAGTITAAQANAEGTLATDIVVSVEGVDDFTLASSGYVTSTAHGLGTAGQELYVSQGTPKTLTTTAPSTGLVQQVGEVVDADTYRISFYAVKSL